MRIIAAKRYLITTDDTYRATLSPSSLRSLEVQGGQMSDAELAAFREDPHWEGAVALRRWDDEAKDPAATTRPFSAFEPMLRDLAAPQWVAVSSDEGGRRDPHS